MNLNINVNLLKIKQNDSKFCKISLKIKIIKFITKKNLIIYLNGNFYIRCKIKVNKILYDFKNN
jgi:hypothetical protein